MNILVDKNWCFTYKGHNFRLYGLYDSKQADVNIYVCFEFVETTSFQLVNIIPHFYIYAKEMHADTRLPMYILDVLDRYLEATE